MVTEFKTDSPPHPSACALCGSRDLRHLFEKKQRHFWLCTGCGLEMQAPLPTHADLKSYYDQQFDSGMYRDFTDAEAMKVMTAQQRLRELSSYVASTGQWMDIGCANGIFVREARTVGIAAEGIEMSAVAASIAQKAGLPVRCMTLEDTPDYSHWDCITAFDVIEHVLNPVDFVRQIGRRLRPGGHLVLTLPDKNCIFRRLMGSRWWFYIPDEHLHYFDKNVILRLLATAGLEGVKVSRTRKPVTFNYGLTQFVEYNPFLYKLMKLAAMAIPERVKETIFSVYIGEMMVIARLTDPPHEN